MTTGTELSYSAVTSFSAVRPGGQQHHGKRRPLGGCGTSSTRLSAEVDKNGRLYVMTTAWTYDSYESVSYRLTVPDTLNKMMEVWEAGLEELFNNA